LFAADLREVSPEAVLADGNFTSQSPPPPYAVALVEGVARRQVELDAAVAACLSSGWTVARMPRVDRCLARLAAYEFLHAAVPADVAISEAAALAAELSTEASPGFLSGVLGALAKRRSEAAPATEPAAGSEPQEAESDAPEPGADAQAGPEATEPGEDAPATGPAAKPDPREAGLAIAESGSGLREAGLEAPEPGADALEPDFGALEAEPAAALPPL
jgi:N utilization substance protein B